VQQNGQIFQFNVRIQTVYCWVGLVPQIYLNGESISNKVLYLLQEMLKHWATNKMFLINFEDKLHNNFSFKGSFRCATKQSDFQQNGMIRCTAELFWSPKSHLKSNSISSKDHLNNYSFKGSFRCATK
jgi:hypothetical protein